MAHPTELYERGGLYVMKMHAYQKLASLARTFTTRQGNAS